MDSPFTLDVSGKFRSAGISEPGATAALVALWRLPITRHAHSGSLEILERYVQLVCLPRAHTIFRCGDLPNGLYHVISGSVRLLALAPTGREKVIDIFCDGQLFGEIGLFMDGPYRSWAQTNSRCMLLYLPRTAVIDVIRCDPGLAQHFLREISGRAQSLIDTLTATVSRSASGRVAAYLLDLSARNCDGDRSRVHFPASKNAVASLLSLSPEALSRTLRRFHADGLVELEGRAVRLIDLPKLRTFLASP